MEKNIEIFDILMLFFEMDFIIFYKFFNDQGDEKIKELEKVFELYYEECDESSGEKNDKLVDFLVLIELEGEGQIL